MTVVALEGGVLARSLAACCSGFNIRHRFARSFLLSLYLVTDVAEASSAQSLPRWTVDASVGAGARAQQTNTTTYSGVSDIWLAAASMRPIGGPRVAPYIQVDVSQNFASGEKACAAGTNSPCPVNFPPSRGMAVSIGARYGISRRVLVGAGIGRGEYDDHPRTFIDGDVSVAMTSHVALRFGARFQWWTANGSSYWFAPITGGLRVF